MKILDQYILKSHVGPFLLGFTVTTGFLFTQVLRNWLDDFLAKGIAPLTILEVFLLSLGHTLALSVPMAVLVSTLMAYGQLTNDNELTALKASGVSLYRVMAPALIAATLLCVAMILFNNLVLPESNHRLAGLLSDIGRKRPTVDIEPGIIVEEFDGYKLLIGEKVEDSDEIHDITILILNSDRSPDYLTAPDGRLRFSEDTNTLFIDLFNGEHHQVPRGDSPDEALYRVTRFKENTIVISDVGDHLQRTERKHRSDREMSIGMMRASIRDKRERMGKLQTRVNDQSRKVVDGKLSALDPEKREQYFAARRSPRPGKLTSGAESRLRDTARIERSAIASYERQIRSLKVELHKKYAIPVACIVFVLCGAPLAIHSGHSGATMAATFSIACFTIYYLFLTGGEKLADRERLSPFLAMWAANIAFGALGIYLSHRAAIESTTFNWRRFDPRTWRRQA